MKNKLDKVITKLTQDDLVPCYRKLTLKTRLDGDSLAQAFKLQVKFKKLLGDNKQFVIQF